MNDAGTAFIEVEPDLKGFGSKLSRGIDPHVNKSAKNVETSFGSAFKGAALAAGGAFAAIGAAGALKGIISGASDLNETVSKSNTIFGANAKEIEAWAGTAAKSMGQSKQGALDAAATFGNLFVQLGTGSGEAAKMSKEMVGLASDFASFHNADPTDVIESMTAAFRGEYDAVQRYVPTINAAAVEQKALKMGLAATTKELTAQDKALATQKLLYEGAGAAIGDFARTSDGLANRQRVLAAQFQDMKDKIGTALLPVVLKLMEGFMNLGKVFGPIAKEVQGGITALFAAFKAGDGDVTSSGFAGVMERIGNAARSVVEWFKANWPQIQTSIASVIDWIQANVVPRVQEVAAFFIAKFSEIVAWVQSSWPAVSEAIGHVVATVQALFEKLAPAVEQVWNTMKTQIDVALAAIKAVIETTLNVINGEWGAIWNGIKDVFAGVWDAIVDVVRGGMAAVVDFFIGGVEKIIDGAARAFGWVPGLGPKLRAAADEVAQFRDEVNSYLAGIEDKTVTIRTVFEQSGNPYTAGSGENATDTRGDTYHTGGIVRGRTGADVPIVAQAGEGVFTAGQMAALGAGAGSGSMDDATIARLAAALAAAVAATPVQVTTSSIARGLHDAGRRR